MTPFFPDWRELEDWPEEPHRRDRFPLLRLVRFQLSRQLEEEGAGETDLAGERTALCINVGNHGLCLLTAQALEEGTVVRVEIPMPTAAATTPTLAEVRWVRALPDAVRGGYAVGLRFML